MHGKLGHGDVHHGNADLVAQQIAQGGAARLVGRLANTCTGTPAFWQMAWKSPAVRPVVVYFWLAEYLITTPPLG